MKVYYQTCRNCGLFQPVLTAFLSTEENARLSPEDKRLCYDCYEKRKQGVTNEEMAQKVGQNQDLFGFSY